MGGQISKPKPIITTPTTVVSSDMEFQSLPRDQIEKLKRKQQSMSPSFDKTSFKKAFPDLCDQWASRMFDIFDEDCDDVLSEAEFIKGMIGLSSISSLEQRASVLFDLCDVNDEGSIKPEQLAIILGGQAIPGLNQEISMCISKSTISERMTQSEFKDFVKSHPGMMIPLITV